MPDILAEIRAWQGKPKALNERLTAMLVEDDRLVPAFILALQNGNDREKGVCLEVLEAATRERPAPVAPHLPFIIGFINCPAPKARLESSRVVANLAAKYPDEAARAVPALLKNTTDEGTVVRWSAAFALGAILKYNEKQRKALLEKIAAILKKEENNGVRNVYLKAVKAVEKKRPPA
jgi:HEAT repeat protein